MDTIEEQKGKYPWGKFFRELAEKLLELKDDEQKQLDFANELKEHGVFTSEEYAKWWNPVAIFQLFAGKRKDELAISKEELMRFLKRYFVMEADIPSNISLLEVFNSKLFLFSPNRKEYEKVNLDFRNALWPFFEELMTQNGPTPKMFDVFKTKHIGTNLFIVCHIIKPDIYLPATEWTTSLSKGIRLPKFETAKQSKPTYQEYMDYLEKSVKQFAEDEDWEEKGFEEIIYNALLQQKSPDTDGNDPYRQTFINIAEKVREGLVDDPTFDAVNKKDFSTKDAYMWVGTKDGKIGKTDVHYEVRRESKDKQIFVQLHFEGKGFYDIELPNTLRRMKSGKKTLHFYAQNEVGWDMSTEDEDTIVDEIIKELHSLHDSCKDSIYTYISKTNTATMTTSKYQTYIDLLEANHNIVLTGAPGTGKTHMAKEIAKEMGAERKFVQFHPSYDYTDFVEGLRPTDKGDGNIAFVRKDGIFKAFCKEAIKEENSDKKFVMIIDEINRGEASKIFGELFYAIDPGYRGDTEGMVQTQYQNLIAEDDAFKDGFYVPKNVYILGTMNDIDRSVESMDFAMRRRFTWVEVTPEDTEDMIDVKVTGAALASEAKQRMHAINDVIAKEAELGPAFQVGPSYFRKLDGYKGDFEKLWRLNIEPLIREYVRGSRRATEIMKNVEEAYHKRQETSNNNTETVEEKEPADE